MISVLDGELFLPNTQTLLVAQLARSLTFDGPVSFDVGASKTEELI